MLKTTLQTFYKVKRAILETTLVSPEAIVIDKTKKQVRLIKASETSFIAEFKAKNDIHWHNSIDEKVKQRVRELLQSEICRSRRVSPPDVIDGDEDSIMVDPELFNFSISWHLLTKNARIHTEPRQLELLAELASIDWSMIYFSGTRCFSRDQVLQGGHRLIASLSTP